MVRKIKNRLPDPMAAFSFKDRFIKIFDSNFIKITKIAAVIVLCLVIGVLLSLLYGALPALSTFGWSFITTATWDPANLIFGAVAPVYGTLVTATLAILIAAPTSFYIAIFITELAPQWIKIPITSAIDLLAAIPSIIYGMWGLFVLSPYISDYIQPWFNKYISPIPFLGMLFTGPDLGIGVFTASIILAIMIIPFITSVMKDIFQAVPKEQKEAAYALGATTWEVSRSIILPYAKVGVFGGILLGLGRAIGETMAVTFVIGNANNINVSLFMPGNTISSAIANQFNEASDPLYTSALIGLGLLLFIITFFILSVAKLMLIRIKAK